MSAVGLLLLLLPLVAAQTYSWGACPSPKVMPNFDIKQYLGRWYEIEKLPAFYERGKCIEANYALRPDGTIEIYNRQFYRNKMRGGEGTGVIADPREPARLGVSFSFLTPYSPYLILSTDYTTVTVVYSCTDVFNIFRIEYAWILSRSRFLDPETFRWAQALLFKEGVPLHLMTKTDQMGCKDV